MSRALSGKSWTRGPNKGATSLSSRSGVGLLRKDPSALTQAQNSRPTQGQYAFNFATADVASQYTTSNRTAIKADDAGPTVTSRARERGIRVLSDEEPETEHETMNSHQNLQGSRIHVHSNHVTLDPILALKLARDGAVVGLSNL